MKTLRDQAKPPITYRHLFPDEIKDIREYYRKIKRYVGIKEDGSKREPDRR